MDLKPPSDGAYLNEADLPKIKGIFWRNNIVGFAPMLPVTVNVGSRQIALLGTYFAKSLTFGTEQFTTGVTKTDPWWKVQGAWPNDDSNDILLGERLANELNARPGSQIEINGDAHTVSGILSTGGY